MLGSCTCGKEIEITMCCSGYECGCMGLPTEPPFCSEECYEKYLINNVKDNLDNTNTFLIFD